MKTILQSKFFTAAEPEEGVIQISGLAGEKCYLIEGKDKALLIDGLSGVGQLKAFVRELTELPVIMAATHGHLDHIGAAFEYKEVRIHPKDISLLYSKAHGGDEARFNFATLFMKYGLKLRTNPQREDTIPACPIVTLPIIEGDRIDLGGRLIEVAELPGHTAGSVVLVDREKKLAFGGDACNLNTLLNLPESETVETYHDSLLRFKKWQGSFDRMYCGHDEAPFSPSIIDDGIRLCERILAGEDDAVETEDMFGGASLLAARRQDNYLPDCSGMCNIVYKKTRIRN